MRHDRAARMAKFLPIFILGVAAIGFLVMTLWNWLLPPLLGLGHIGFWQALGVLLLSRILFGGFAGGGDHGARRRRTLREWERMSPDERERLRDTLRGHLADPEPPRPDAASS